MRLKPVVDILKSRHAQRTKNERPYTDYTKIIQSRDDVLSRFQAAFAPTAIDDLAASDFRDFLSFKHNKHWTGLQRATSHVCDDMLKLRTAIKHLFDESVSADKRIDDLTQKQELSVSGINVGILTPLLLIQFPEKYGVWNSKAESALKTLGIWPQFPKGATKGQKYVVLNTIYLQLSEASGLDLWSLDGLWHVINEVCRIDAEQECEAIERERREYYEGKKKPTSGYVYERNPKARSECIRHHGAVCVGCGFDFFEFYGELGLGFIHVHHVTDIALQEETYIDAKKDLVPVCPNCHAMLHKNSKPARTVDDLRTIIAEWRVTRQV
jgi:hypothetical protein